MEVNEIHSAALQNTPPKNSPSVQPQQWAKELEKAGAKKHVHHTHAHPSETLTKDELTYFEDLFQPAQQDQQNQITYSQNGAKSSSALGTVVDRKG